MTDVPTAPDRLVISLAADDKEWLSLRHGTTGWAAYRSERPSSEQALFFVRFGLDREDFSEALIVVRELLISFSQGSVASSRVLRELPLARMEQAVNQPAWRSKVLARLPSWNSVQIPFPQDDGPSDIGWWLAHPHPYASPKVTVDVPAGRGRPDEFYEAVARGFGYLASVSKRPAQDMAEANGVPVTTVHGWVKEARRRGFLPAGERSRKGGQA